MAGADPLAGSVKTPEVGPGSGGLPGVAADPSALTREIARRSVEGESLADRLSPVAVGASETPRSALPILVPDALARTEAGSPVPTHPFADPEIASDADSGRNVRIPEPASLTLIAAGLIGLAARNRMRKSLHPKRLDPPAVPEPASA